MISFAFPWALILLPVPWLVWRFAPPHRERSRALRVPFFREVAHAAGLDARDGAVILRRRAVQMVAAVLCWVCLVVGLARPERLGDPLVIETAARDLVLAVDISGSMDTRDFQDAQGQPQQRLAAVREVLTRFIADRDGDRVALILFGTRAFVQAPFTQDLQTLAEMLEETEVGMAGPNTAIGDAIGLAIRLFETSEVDERLLILLSDGADTSSRMTPRNAAGIAARNGVTISTVGVGDPDGEGDGRVDLASLQEIASATGGAYFYASDETALDAIYEQIDEQNPRAVDTTSFQPREPLAHLAFGAAVLILLTATGWMQLRHGTRA